MTYGKAAQFTLGAADGGQGHQRPEFCAVLALPPGLGLVAALARRRSQLLRRNPRLYILGLEEDGEVPPQYFFRRVALAAFRPGVPGDHPALRIEHVDGVVGDAVHQQTEALLAFCQREVGLPQVLADLSQCLLGFTQVLVSLPQILVVLSRILARLSQVLTCLSRVLVSLSQVLTCLLQKGRKVFRRGAHALRKPRGGFGVDRERTRDVRHRSLHEASYRRIGE